MASRDEVVKRLCALELIFRDQLDDVRLALYVAALEDLEIEQLDAAVANVIRDHERFFPTPGEIRAAVPQPPVMEPYHQLFLPDHRSLEQIAAERRRLAPLWGEVRRVAQGGKPRPIAEVLADMDLTSSQGGGSDGTDPRGFGAVGDDRGRSGQE